MALKKKTKKDSIGPIPMAGTESIPESFSEYSADQLFRIAESAYYKADARGYEPGHEIQDWLEAEAEMAR